MHSTNRLLDDLTRVASGAASSFSGLKGDIEALVRRQIERLLADADMVSRDEFEAVRSMAAKARAENEALERRIGALEKAVAKRAPAKKAAPRRSRTTTKATTKTAKAATSSPKPAPKPSEK